MALCKRDWERVFFCATEVKFAELSEAEIEWYLNTGEPFDKAGAYGLQGQGARLVRQIRGDYFNVIGLPVRRVYEELTAAGFAL